MCETAKHFVCKSSTTSGSPKGCPCGTLLHTFPTPHVDQQHVAGCDLYLGSTHTSQCKAEKFCSNVEPCNAGDELTWNMDDWDWDSINLLATPKPGTSFNRQTACSSQNLLVGALSSRNQPVSCARPGWKEASECTENSAGCQALCTAGLPMMSGILGSSSTACGLTGPDAPEPDPPEPCPSDGSAELQEVCTFHPMHLSCRFLNSNDGAPSSCTCARSSRKSALLYLTWRHVVFC